MAQLKFELTYYGVSDQRVNYNATVTPRLVAEYETVFRKNLIDALHRSRLIAKIDD